VIPLFFFHEGNKFQCVLRERVECRLVPTFQRGHQSDLSYSHDSTYIEWMNEWMNEWMSEWVSG
jgi:hypothetical protein